MKKAINLILALTIALTAHASFAGGVDSGGGGAFMCADGKTELLDLWEAEALYDLSITRSNEDVISQFNRAANKLAAIDSALPAEVTAIAQKLFTDKVSLKAGIELEPPRDANSNYKKSGCSLVGMMFFDRLKQKLVIDEKHFSKLKSNTDIAASMMHEAWYLLVRKNASQLGPVTDSVNSRKLVGCLFSDSASCLQSATVKTGRTFYSCKSTTSEIEIAGSNGVYFFNILKLNGRTFKNVTVQTQPTGNSMGVNLADGAIYKQLPLADFDLRAFSKMPSITFQPSLGTIEIHNLEDKFKVDDELNCEKR